MQYRQLSATDDYTIGLPFYADSPQAVGQAILTRLRLWQGEWFLDTTDGTPWLQNILGKQRLNPDIYIKNRILGTPNVSAITSYSGTFVPGTRAYAVTATCTTPFGPVTVSVTL